MLIRKLIFPELSLGMGFHTSLQAQTYVMSELKRQAEDGRAFAFSLTVKNNWP